jgi:hypothetical protein
MASQRTSTTLAASGFASSASVAGAGDRDGRVVKLHQQRGWRARRSEFRADDDFMPGFDCGSSGFGGGGGSGSGSELMADAGVRRNGPSMSSGPQPVGNQGPRGGSKLMIGLIGRVAATVEAVGWLPLRYGIIEYTVSVILMHRYRNSVLSSLVYNQGMFQ